MCKLINCSSILVLMVKCFACDTSVIMIIITRKDFVANIGLFQVELPDFADFVFKEVSWLPQYLFVAHTSYLPIPTLSTISQNIFHTSQFM